MSELLLSSKDKQTKEFQILRATLVAQILSGILNTSGFSEIIIGQAFDYANEVIKESGLDKIYGQKDFAKGGRTRPY